MTSILNYLSIPLPAADMSVTAAAREGNGGSRESSEFEFVGGGKVGLPPPNPLLLPSSPLLPSPQLSPASSSQQQDPANPVIEPAPVPQIPPTQLTSNPIHTSNLLPQSMSLPTIRTGGGEGGGEAQVKVATAGSPPSPGVFSWVKGGNFLSKVVEKTKTMSENVITTLDPQMKEFIKSGGDIEVVVASDKEGKVGPVREAFQEVFGQATVYGLGSKAASIAEQPVGFASGRQAVIIIIYSSSNNIIVRM